MDKITEAYKQLPYEEKKKIYDIYFDKQTLQDLKEKAERIIFYKVPPTPEEFLNPENGWISKSFAETIYPWVREEFLECLNKEKNYNKLVEYGSTRIGKTYLAILLITYSIVYIHHLREPALYYGLSPLTDLAIYIISFKYDKTRELYLRPMFKMMEQSDRFKQVKFQDKVIPEQERLGRDTIVYSKASISGEITLASGLQIQLGNDDALAFIGANLLSAFISEISFWTENAGATEESIYRLYTDVSDRINATVGTEYLAFLYLDTSANDTESIIEKHVLNELRHRPDVRFKWTRRWDALPDNGKNFPKWHKARKRFLEQKQYDNETELYEDLYNEGYMFKVITGNGNVSASIVTDKAQLVGVPKDLIIHVPIDSLNAFKDNLLKSIKDIAGYPTVKENKFIDDINLINNIFSNPYLYNIEGALVADAGDMPEQLLWNQLKTNKKIFYKYSNAGEDQYRILRAPGEYRYCGLDNAFSIRGDVMGLGIVHKEWSQEYEGIIYIIDLNCPVVGTEKGINLDAPAHMLLDIINYSNMAIYGLYTDTFSSEGQKQLLERNKVKVVKQSVDRDVVAYQYLLSCLNQRLLKGGRNIFLKNNLQCLMTVKNDKGKTKVDHPVGTTNNKYFGDWENSTCGTFAKDVSDALCQALWGAYNHEYIPSTIYELENKKFSSKKEDTIIVTQNAVKKMFEGRPRL